MEGSQNACITAGIWKRRIEVVLAIPNARKLFMSIVQPEA